MTVSVELPEEVVRRLLEITGERQESPAIARAVEDFLNRATAARRIQEGFSHYPLTSDEVETEFDSPP